MYQLRPLVFSLGLNNPPRRYFIPLKSCGKKRWRFKQGDSWCKMAGAGIQSLAKLRPQMCATNKITVARIATVKSLNLRADCHRPDLTVCTVFLATWARSLAIRSPLESRLPRSYSCCGNLRDLTGELSTWPNSSTHHFTSTVPLFDTSYLFDARLSRCKTDTRRVV
jgi:hypothetical protein